MAMGNAGLDARVQKSQFCALRQSSLYQVAVTPLDNLLIIRVEKIIKQLTTLV